MRSTKIEFECVLLNNNQLIQIKGGTNEDDDINNVVYDLDRMVEATGVDNASN